MSLKRDMGHPFICCRVNAISEDSVEVGHTAIASTALRFGRDDKCVGVAFLCGCLGLERFQSAFRLEQPSLRDLESLLSNRPRIALAW
jgi:hypothetical protein